MRNLMGACLLLVAVIGVNTIPQDPSRITTKATTPKRTTKTTTPKITTTKKTTTTTTKPTTTTAAATTTAACPYTRFSTGGRIVGGVAVTIAEFPYQLSFRTSGSHFCGASIISENWALTAAHCCVFDISTLTLKAGSASRTSGGTVHKVTQMTPHPSYNDATHDYDIALLKVGTPFVYNTGVIAPVSLPTPTADEVPANTSSTVSGWGTMVAGASTLPTTLMAVNVPTVSQASCKVSYGDASITDRMLCAGYSTGGKDSCQGDSGGPLVVSACGKKYQIGVVSWGYSCAQPNYPGIYSSVINLRTWITTTSGV